MYRQFILWTCCALLIALFMYASVSKIANPEMLVNDMQRQPFWPWLNNVFIVLIPTIEIAISAALIFDRTRIYGLWASLVLMAAFSLYTGLALLKVFGKDTPCSCGGVIHKLSWPDHLKLNIAYVVIAVIGIIAYYKKDKLPGHTKLAA